MEQKEQKEELKDDAKPKEEQKIESSIEAKEDDKITTKCCMLDTQKPNVKALHYREGYDNYNGTIALNDDKIQFNITQDYELTLWEAELELSDLKAMEPKWAVLMNEANAFEFMVEAFKNSAVILTKNDEMSLKMNFKLLLGHKEVKLFILIKRDDCEIKKVLMSQGDLIKKLYEEKERVTSTIEHLQEDLKLIKQIPSTHKATVVLKEITGNASTYNPAFQDIAVVTPGNFAVVNKGTAKWDLCINAVNFTDPNGYTASFRLLLTNTATKATLYWPSDKGFIYQIQLPSNGTFSRQFNCADVTEIDQGAYSVSLQWAFNSNNAANVMNIDPTYGDIRMVVETY